MRTLIIFLILNCLVFILIGYFIFNERPNLTKNLDSFIEALQNPKVGQYYLNLNKLQGKFLTLKFEGEESREVCFKIEEVLKKIEKCEKGIIITLDEHASNSLMVTSFYAKNTIFSEFLTGHVKVEGLTFSDILGVIR